MKKMYISPTGRDKFSFNSYFMSEPPNVDVYLEATQEMIDGLRNHTLCWQGKQIVPHTKTAEEIAEEESQVKRQEAQSEIFALKRKLTETDYKAIKYAEGEMTAYEYEPIKQKRREWRAKINELELFYL